MTVGQLREMLAILPQDAPVFFNDDEHGELEITKYSMRQFFWKDMGPKLSGSYEAKYLGGNPSVVQPGPFINGIVLE